MRCLTLSIALALTGCPDGYRLVRAEGAPHLDIRELGNTISNLARAAEKDKRCAEHLAPYVHCVERPKWKRYCRSAPDHDDDRVPGGKAWLGGAPCSRLSSRASFVHLSDIQLREHLVRIEGTLGELAYDGLTSGVVRHPLLERYDYAALLATVLSINAMTRRPPDLDFGPCPSPASPSFVVHTGDSVDAGLYSELMEMLTVMFELDVPFFNLVGNHDNQFFGTFPPAKMQGLNVVAPFIPILDADRFMRFHRSDGYEYDLAVPYTGWRTPHPATMKGVGGLPGSLHHGFDLACTNEPRRRPGLENKTALCPAADGYYAFDVPLAVRPLTGGSNGCADKRRSLRVLALNTAEFTPDTQAEAFEQLSRGHVHDEQLRWLERQLADQPAEGERYFVVLGHHPLDVFVGDQGERLSSMLTREPRVLAYLAGHTHVDRIEPLAREQGGAPLWQIVGGSTLVYPQFGRIVELLEDGASCELYIRVVSFRQRMSDLACDNDALKSVSDPCRRLACLAEKGRRGASLDLNDRARRDEAEAVPNANALMLVYTPRR